MDTLKSFKVEKFLNKRLVKRRKGYSIKYLVCWKGYDQKWDRWYNVRGLDNALNLVCNYKKALA